MKIILSLLRYLDEEKATIIFLKIPKILFFGVILKMSDMLKPPELSLGKWIVVNGTDCVVSKIYEDNSPFGSCEVVFNIDKPTTHDVVWDGQKWVFPERTDFGGYADRTSNYVFILKQGKYWMR